MLAGLPFFSPMQSTVTTPKSVISPARASLASSSAGGLGAQGGDEHVDRPHLAAVLELDRVLAGHAGADEGEVGVDAAAVGVAAHLEVDVAQALVAEHLGEQTRQGADLFVVVADDGAEAERLGELVLLATAEDLDALELAVLVEQRRLRAVGVVGLLRPDLERAPASRRGRSP